MDGTGEYLNRQVPRSIVEGVSTAPATAAETAVRWLSAEELDAWLALAALMTRLPSLLDAQLQRDADLSFFEYMVMASLSGAPNRTRQMSDLAAMTSSSLSRLSHAANRLEQHGYLTRSRCAGSVGRTTNATLTDAGLAKITAAAPGHVRTVRELLFDALTARDVTALARIGRRVRPRLDPQDTLPQVR
jgi:DNA-binding MarR family transcriptional regulator